MFEGRTPSLLSGALSQASVYYLHVTTLSALPPELCLVVINTGRACCLPAQALQSGMGMGGGHPWSQFNLRLKLFSFVRGESKQMFIKVNFVNQSLCVAAPCPLRPPDRVGFLHQHLASLVTGTHPPPHIDPTSCLLPCSDSFSRKSSRTSLFLAPNKQWPLLSPPSPIPA